jgi:outer membrane protein OmpA-like peptidoglycan-associated protein
MKKLIVISLLLPVFMAKAQDNPSSIQDVARFYYAMNKEKITLYKDGRVVFFDNEKAYTALLDHNLEKTDIKPAPELNSLGINGHFSYDSVNQKIYFSKNGELYSSEWKNKKWKKPQKIEIIRIKAERKNMPGSLMAYSGWRYKPDDITITGVYNPAVSDDGKRIYYAADIEGSVGGLDIWYSDINEHGNFSPPVNLGATVNSPEDEDNPFTADGTSLFFTSVPQTEKEKQPDTPEHIVTANETQLFFIPLTLDNVLPLPLTDILITEDKREEPELTAEFPIIPDPSLPEETNEEVTDTKSTKAPIIPELAHFEQESTNVFIKNPRTCVFLFDFDKSNLIGQEKEISMIIEFLNLHEDGNFLIIGYTDERGSYEYNEKLSQKRAKQIYDILIKKGIPKSKLGYMGLGKLNPIIKNAQTEEEHQMNRRVEIQNMN